MTQQEIAIVEYNARAPHMTSGARWLLMRELAKRYGVTQKSIREGCNQKYRPPS